MKEEQNKKLPPKMFGASTSTKITNDDILSNLLRINNFDSISSIKDESLDIDLSACVDPTGIINNNSQSATDFWRVLDESAQNSQLDLSTCNDEEDAILDLKEENIETANFSHYNRDDKNGNKKRNTFTGTFLRPDPPATFLLSPLKKKNKALPAEPTQHTTHVLSGSVLDSKKVSASLIKEEPLEQFISRDSSSNSSKFKKDVSQSSSLLGITLPSSLAANENKSISLQTKLSVVEEVTLPSSEPLYKCLDCNDLILCGQKEYSTHNLASHRIRFKCAVCERDFEQESGLKKHLKTHRSVDARKDAWKKCPECGKCLKLGSLWMHRKIHSDNKKYSCDICGQKFVQKINLTHHSRVHTAEKPYECPECQKRFQERSHLQRHQKYHAQTRSYRCEKCGKMYKTERCLKVHNLVHLEQRPFACNVCDKSFISNSKLKQHSNIHTGERPFKCNYCPRDFTNFPNWLKHTRRRHKVDHKTGEHLENIPSYCAKKSTKTTKIQKATEVCAVSMDVIQRNTSIKNADTTKNQTKRKQKEDTSADVECTAPQQNSALISELKTSTALSGTMPVVSKAVKVKRERKQLTPKQVQKPPSSQILIKEEISEFKSGSETQEGRSNFSDLHCLSITSAEELIMEQALEMEECGLYISPSAVNSDNLTWSNSTQSLQFKIKNEITNDEMFDDKISLVRVGNKKCSNFASIQNLEYFTSPSLEITSTNCASSSNAIGLDVRTPVTNNYSSIFPFNSLDGISNSTSNNLKSSIAVQSNVIDTNATLMQNEQKQAVINQFYFPMSTMNVPMLMQTHQVLPSVDTLFSSHTSNINYIRGKGLPQVTTQKL